MKFKLPSLFLFRANHFFGALDPLGYHVINISLHAAASALFTYLCLSVIFAGDVTLSGCAGSLFAVHPIHTEAVSICPPPPQ